MHIHTPSKEGRRGRKREGERTDREGEEREGGGGEKEALVVTSLVGYMPLAGHTSVMANWLRLGYWPTSRVRGSTPSREYLQLFSPYPPNSTSATL